MSGPIHHIGELREQVYPHYPDGWPWQVVGVFPTADTPPDEVQHSWFNYTVGLGAAELWVSCMSLEGRGMDNNLTCAILNVVAGGWQVGLVGPGDSVIVPLGIPDPDGEWERDADAIWWVSDNRVPSPVKQVNLRPRAEWTVPIVWSSPLGWPE